MTWRLTPGVSFSDVQDTLLHLKQRICSNGNQVKEFFIDNCCSWRNCLQSVFGKDLKVYLDLFHVVKRISDKIPKRHRLRSECMNHLRMVFRDPVDRGPERKMDTPEPHILVHQLDEFQAKWNDMYCDGTPILSVAAMKEIANLKLHINKGCLSNIRPGRGTNRNEALHRNINAIIKSSRYGIELAYALLSTCFYSHNEYHLSLKEHRVARPIAVYEEILKSIPVNCKETFGITLTRDRPNVVDQHKHQSEPHLDINKSTYKDFFECLSGSTQTSHIVTRGVLSQGSGTDSDSDDDTAGIDNTNVSVLVARNILLSALGLYFIHKKLTSLSSTAILHRSKLPFMNTLISDMFCQAQPTIPMKENESDAHRKRLNDVLSMWNFKGLSVPGDGNCLFTAVAVNLQHLATKSKDLSDHLQSLGIQVCEDGVPNIIKKLRKSVVDELLGSNTTEYQSFLSHEQLPTQAQRFLRDGEFMGEIGDLMVKALCNVLQTPIILFTSVKDMPIIVCTPTHNPLKEVDFIYLAYNQYGPGHYDVALYGGGNETQGTSRKRQFCSCASRRPIKGLPCCLDPTLKSYSTRCPCYNKQLACTTACNCVGCKNEFGSRPVVAGSDQPARKRRRHDTQEQPLKGIPGVDFAKRKGALIKTGSCSSLELFTTAAILRHIYGQELDTSDIDPDKVHQLYTAVVYTVNVLNLNIPIFPRTLNEVYGMCVQFSKKLAFYSAVHFVPTCEP